MVMVASPSPLRDKGTFSHPSLCSLQSRVTTSASPALLNGEVVRSTSATQSLRPKTSIQWFPMFRTGAAKMSPGQTWPPPRVVQKYVKLRATKHGMLAVSGRTLWTQRVDPDYTRGIAWRMTLASPGLLKGDAGVGITWPVNIPQQTRQMGPEH